MYQVVGEPQLILPFPWIFLQGVLAGNFLPQFFFPKKEEENKSEKKNKQSSPSHANI